jgi:hypothetical protein
MKPTILAFAALFLLGDAASAQEITDPATRDAFRDEVIRAGFNCPRVVVVIRMDIQTEFGVPFTVACSGPGIGLHYRVTVQPQTGHTRVEIWRR